MSKKFPVTTKPEPQKSPRPERLKEPLPLVLEILPGQAGEGLIEVFEPGSFEGKSLKQLCEQTLAKKDWSIEERQIVDDILRQLEGGKLLHKGREIEGPAWEFAALEETQAKEKYLYVPVRAIKPQEGGR